ncbi:hypothetical protein F383_29312 [Gossypium arboreum]|uniref:Uncharacterized protein n=1 Tax=Gossypium arboreum TaxID=29729 RepID=A0A0B0MXD0_GOSAR|nr:hypothetical protein F383_29312 [Gossypium arboreum]
METFCFLTLNLSQKGMEVPGNGACRGVGWQKAWGGKRHGGDQGFSFFAVFLLLVWARVSGLS